MTAGAFRRIQPDPHRRRAEIRGQQDGRAGGADQGLRRPSAAHQGDRAAEHNIPMVENVPLAKECESGRPIKAKWFKAVTEILAAVYRLRWGAA